MLKINSAALIPNPVGAGENLLVQVKIITWNTLRDGYTSDSLKNSGETWESLRNKAVDMDFSCPDWNTVKERYRTWNSLKRYGMSWNDLKEDR